MTAKLSVLAPIQITDAMLVSSTIPETDYAAWSASTTYAAGQFCISTTTHRIYQSQVANNLNHDPTDILNRSDPTVYWTEYDPTNRWAMFDGEVSTASSAANSFTVVIRPGFFNAVYLGGLDADSLTITVRDSTGGSVIYATTSTLEASQPADYDEYFWGRFKPMSDFIATGIDEYNAAELTVTLTKTGGIAKCGVLAVGDLIELGDTQRDAKAKPKTYSYIATDKWGKTKITRRKAATDISMSAVLSLSDATTAIRTVRDLLDVPAVWIASDLPEYEWLRCYGLGSGEIEPLTARECRLSITVQGLI